MTHPQFQKEEFEELNKEFDFRAVFGGNSESEKKIKSFIKAHDARLIAEIEQIIKIDGFYVGEGAIYKNKVKEKIVQEIKNSIARWKGSEE